MAPRADSMRADSMRADSMFADSMFADSIFADSRFADSMFADSLPMGGESIDDGMMDGTSDDDTHTQLPGSTECAARGDSREGHGPPTMYGPPTIYGRVGHGLDCRCAGSLSAPSLRVQVPVPGPVPVFGMTSRLRGQSSSHLSSRHAKLWACASWEDRRRAAGGGQRLRAGMQPYRLTQPSLSASPYTSRHVR